jgi:hypothetical protein
MSEKTTLQPSEIFRKLKIKHTDEAERLLDTILKLLVYMKPGDKLKTGGITYTKLDADTVHLGVRVSAEEIADTLERKKVIRIPT